MFCKNCGLEMDSNAKFCSKCGTPRSMEQPQVRKVIEDNNIKFQLKPKFNLIYDFIINSLYVLCYGAILIIYAYTFNLWVIMISIIVIITSIKTLLDKKQHDSLEYNFYATKVEYKDGFFNKEQKELKYKYIREITMSQNILERICGIGTIRIFTNASNYQYNIYRNRNREIIKNGIYIHCVDNVEEKYKIIKQIIDEGTPEEY